MGEAAWSHGNKRGILLVAGIVLFLLLCFGCHPSGEGFITGTISYSNGFLDPGNTYLTEAYCYVFLDSDTDILNGYQQRLIIELTASATSLDYEIDTSEVPAGSYFLLGAYDWSEGDDNTDPGNPSYWEAKGWYGSGNTSPPVSPNVADLSGEYDIILYGLG
jgi:hypothetical protein